MQRAQPGTETDPQTSIHRRQRDTEPNAGFLPKTIHPISPSAFHGHLGLGLLPPPSSQEGCEGPPRGDPLPAPRTLPSSGRRRGPSAELGAPPADLDASLQGSGSPLLTLYPSGPPSPVPPGARYLGAGPPAALSPPPPSGLPGAGSAAAGWAARAVPHRYKRKPSPGGRKRRLRHLHRARLGRPAPARC